MAKTFIEYEGQKLLLQKNFYGVEPFVSSCDLCCMRGANKCHVLNCDEWDGENFSCYYVLDDEKDMPFPKSAKTPQAKRGGGRQDK